MCTDYMKSLAKTLDPDALARAEVDLVIISNGSWKMIKSYRRIFKTPFPIYTDPSLDLYRALGMTLQTLDGGLDTDKGDYVKHGTLRGVGMVIANAAKVGMPVWEKGGSIPQLGGEFVLGPGMTCSFTHRMPNTRSHAPILQVLAEAGVEPRLLTLEEETEWKAEEEVMVIGASDSCDLDSCHLSIQHASSSSSSSRAPQLDGAGVTLRDEDFREPLFDVRASRIQAFRELVLVPEPENDGVVGVVGETATILVKAPVKTHRRSRSSIVSIAYEDWVKIMVAQEDLSFLMFS